MDIKVRAPRAVDAICAMAWRRRGRSTRPNGLDTSRGDGVKAPQHSRVDVPAGTDITKKSAVAKETQASIEITSKKYKSVADRSSMLFFLMSDLAKIHSYYVYSLAAYTKVFYRGIDLVTDKPEPELDDEGNELPVKVVELNDEELAARC